MSVIGFLPVQLTLTAPAVLPTTPDPVRAVSSPVIPGRVLQGMLAAAAGASDPDARATRIQDWVVRGDTVQVGPAFGAPPVDPDGSAGRYPVHPAPLSWHTADRYLHGGQAQLVDLLDQDSLPADTTRLTQVRGVLTAGPACHPVRVDTSIGWHQQRDRRRGRPIENTGGPFEMVAVAAGQSFTSSWRITGQDADQVAELLEYGLLLDLADAEPLRIGAAAATRYGGGVHLSLLDPVDPLPQASRLQARHTPAPPLTEWTAGTERDVVLISPTLVADGAVRSAATGAAVLTAWGGPETVQIVDSWIEHTRYGGYNTLWRSPVTEQWAAAAGSVVRLRAARTISITEQVAREAHPIGARTAEGTGRHLLLDPAQRPGSLSAPLGCPAIAGASAALLDDQHRQPSEHIPLVTLPDGTGVPRVTLTPPTEPAGWVTDPVADLQHRLFRQAMQPALRTTAAAIVSRSRNLPTPHLLARVAALATHPDPGQALAALRSALHPGRRPALFAAAAAAALSRWHLVDTPATDWLRADPNNRQQWWGALNRKPFSPAERLNREVLTPVTLDCWVDKDQTVTDWLIHHDTDLVAALLQAVLIAARRAAKDPT